MQGIDRTGSVEGFFQVIDQLAADPGSEAVLVFTAVGNGFSPADLDEGLRSRSIPILGGIFPGLLFGRERLNRGTVAVGLPSKPDLCLIPGLSDPELKYEEILERGITYSCDSGTMLVFVDGFSERIGRLVESLFNVFGLDVNYLGGGCGAVDFERKPSIISNQGLMGDCAVVALSCFKSGIGIGHGWESVAGPFRITRSVRNRIITIDDEPALEVYRRVVEEHSGGAFGPIFYELAQRYPFGINRLDAERVIRDTYQALDDGSLLCIGDVPAQSFVDIMAGQEPVLIQAAERALEMARSSFPSGFPRGETIFLDCISRALYMGDHFEQEIAAVAEEGVPLVGALTIGEIANYGQEFLEFYNKTAVVGVIQG